MRPIGLPLALSLTVVASAGLAADAPLRPEHLWRAMGLKIGSWHSTVTEAEVRVFPGPKDDAAEVERAAETVRRMYEKKPSEYECLRGLPERIFLPGVHVATGCDFSRVEAQGGRFSVAAICAGPRSTEHDITAEGSYTADAVTTRSEMKGSIGDGHAIIRLKVESRFTGECPLIITPSAPD